MEARLRMHQMYQHQDGHDCHNRDGCAHWQAKLHLRGIMRGRMIL